MPSEYPLTLSISINLLLLRYLLLVSFPPLLINLISTYVVWFDEIRNRRYFLMQFAIDLERIFKSTVNKDFGLQFFGIQVFYLYLFFN